jgi:spore germination protein KA
MKINTILRIVYLIAANVLGILGITILTIAVFTYLCNKRVFGVPYLTPFSPLTTEDLKDSVVVVPIWAMLSRPKAIANDKNMVRTTGKSLSKEEKDSQ